MTRDRRGFLRLGAIALSGTLAGCSGGSGGENGGANGGGETTTTSTPTTTRTATETRTVTETKTVTATGTAGGNASADSGGTGTIDEWLSGTDNYDGSIADLTGSNVVEVTVGAEGNGGNFAFSPPAISVSSGTTVTWAWTGEGGAHNVVAEGGTFDSGEPQQGSDVTFEHVFESTGTFLYRCEPHGALGMKGSVLVG